MTLLLLLPTGMCFAAPTRDANLLKSATEIQDVTNSKEFYVNTENGNNPYKDLQIFVVAREVEDPLRKGWYEFEFVGRAAVAETSSNNAHFVLYKPFKGMELKKGDHLLETGDPLTLEEMDLMRKEVLGVLNRDKELEDLYTGLISVKFGVYEGNLTSTSNSFTNEAKKGGPFLLTNFGLRWWFFFNPQLGFDFEFARSGTIPTVGERLEPETSTQTYLNPGLLYRGRLLFIPTIYSLTYFINGFSTTNANDALLSSTYTGLDLGVTLYYPFRIQLLKLGPVAFSFNNIEGGVAYAPSVQVSDNGFSRGTSVSGSQVDLHGGIEFNLAIRGLRFTNDLFFVFEGGEQIYSLSFSGATSGNQQNGSPIPANGVFTENQSWYGVRLKYNMRDYIGELMGGL